MTATQRIRPLLLIPALVAILAVLMAFGSPTRVAPVASPWAPSWSEASVECELRSGCQQLVGMIADGSPHSAWAVGRLQLAVRTPELGPDIHAMARQGLALAGK